MNYSPELRIAEPFMEAAWDGATDAALVEHTLAGDGRAFEQLVAAYHRRIFNFIHQMTKHRQDAEDLTQQTFIKAFKHLDQFQANRPLINWLLTIARNTTISHFRGAKQWEAVPDDLPGEEPSPATAAEEREESNNLWDRARTVLPRLQFEVLWLRFGEDLSVKETAEVASLSQTYVKILVFRARRALLKANLRS